MTNYDYKSFYHRYLPHIQPPGAMLFITYRLAGSLPQAAVERLQADKVALQRQLAAMPPGPERNAYAYLEQRRMFGRWDQALDTNPDGPHWLRQHEVATLVASSLHFMDGKRYDLDCYCIMSNHVHLVMTPRRDEHGEYWAMQNILHSLKGYTAGKVNRLLGRTGAFWQHESYDHYVRDDDEWRRIRWYVISNPVKAGLVSDSAEWEWTYCRA